MQFMNSEQRRIFSIDFIRRPCVCPIYLILYLESPTHNKVISIYIFFPPGKTTALTLLLLLLYKKTSSKLSFIHKSVYTDPAGFPHSPRTWHTITTFIFLSQFSHLLSSHGNANSYPSPGIIERKWFTCTEPAKLNM